jgi:outer membrane protein OmpA-like peptidoglycan-associated protein/tetratricopeptide (TPR) repeat protein
MRRALLTFLLLITAFNINAQDWKRQKADEYYSKYDFGNALDLYETLKNKDAEVYRRIGEIYYTRSEYDKAADAYGELMKQGGFTAEDIYRYAYLLSMAGRYDESVKWMNKYADMKPSDSRAIRFLEDPGFFKKLQKIQSQVDVYLTDINSKNSDFGPAYYTGDYIVFASGRGYGRIWGGNYQPYLDLYIAEITEDNNLKNAKRFLNRKVNAKYHDGPAAFNKAGDLMIVTRNIYGEKLEENKLWLYELTKDENGNWSDPKPLPFNSKDYSCGHATLNNAGNIMFFASDMPGGYGKSDIYVSYRDANGNWSKPQNLGNAVNTEGDEKFPFYDEASGYLFVASDGLPGLGGLDLFVIKTNSGFNKFSNPVNLGRPINSEHDDFAITYGKFFQSGFFSSNRDGGVGSDDIYGFRNLDLKGKTDFYTISGTVSDENQKPVEGAVVELYDPTGKLVDKVKVGADGKYEFNELVYPKNYKLKVTYPGYTSNEIQITAGDLDNWGVKKSIRVKSRVPYYCKMQITPLYYDLDKSFIRKNYYSKLDSIVEILKENPELRLNISSHTDSRASDAYNMRLSKRRALAVVEYLTSKGIARNRLVVSWHGERQLVNACKDGVRCSEEQHQLNRRTEFKIIGCEKYKR